MLSKIKSVFSGGSSPSAPLASKLKEKKEQKPKEVDFKFTADKKTKPVVEMKVDANICKTCKVDHHLREQIKKGAVTGGLTYKTMAKWHPKIKSKGCSDNMEHEFVLNGVNFTNQQFPNMPIHKDIEVVVLQGLNQYKPTDPNSKYDTEYRNGEKYLQDTLCAKKPPLFNFYIDINGNVYEGAMLDKGSHTTGWNNKTVGVMLMGNYMSYKEYICATDPMDWIKTPIPHADKLTKVASFLDTNGGNLGQVLNSAGNGALKKKIDAAIKSSDSLVLDQALGLAQRTLKFEEAAANKLLDNAQKDTLSILNGQWPSVGNSGFSVSEIGGMVTKGPLWAMSRIKEVAAIGEELTAFGRSCADFHKKRKGVFYDEDKKSPRMSAAEEEFQRENQDKFTKPVGGSTVSVQQATTKLVESLAVALGDGNFGRLHYLSTATMLSWGLASPGYGVANPKLIRSIIGSSGLTLIASEKALQEIGSLPPATSEDTVEVSPQLTAKPYDLISVVRPNYSTPSVGNQYADLAIGVGIDSAKDLFSDSDFKEARQSRYDVFELNIGIKVAEVRDTEFIEWRKELYGK